MAEQTEEEILEAYEAATARVSKAQSAEAAKRKRARMVEFVEHVAPLLEADPDLKKKELDEGGGDVGGWIVVRNPKDSEYKRWRFVKFNQSNDRGAKDAQAKVDSELATSCVVYPAPAAYEAICKAFPATHDAVAAIVLRAAEAQREAEGKG